MSNNKQSSIEWVEQQFQTIIEKGNVEIENLIWQQAKAMHKQEIIDAANKLLYHSTGPGDTAAKQYYNETYGGQDESNH